MTRLFKRKRSQVLPAAIPKANVKRVQAYQLVEGFTRCPVASDGNCFYTATGFFCGTNALEMRSIVMSYFIYKKAEYSIFFESEADFLEAVRANRQDRVWNSELCDIAPHAVAQILKRDIIIHNFDGSTIQEITTPLENKDEIIAPPIHLFRSYNHYEILIPNNKLPNKNICPLPDISAFYEVIDLCDDEVYDLDIEDYDDCMSCDKDFKCLIKF